MTDPAEIAAKLGGGPADIPGLWFVPGYPELTTSQLRQVAALDRAANYALDAAVRAVLQEKG